MREFREAQERRDRELLESDMNDAGADRGRAARPVDEGAASRDELPADASGWTDEGARGPVDEGLADEDVGGPGVDDPFADEMLADEPPPDEFGDELPPEEDDELRWDPETQSWR